MKLYINKQFPHVLPDLEHWPINELSTRRLSFVDKIVDETVDIILNDGTDLVSLMEQVIQLEERRIKKDPWSVDPPNEKAFWRNIKKTIGEIDKLPKRNEQRIKLGEEVLARVIKVYAQEIAGKFKPSMFRFARKFCNAFFSLLFNKFSDGRFGFWGGKKTIGDKIRLTGHVEHVRNLFDKGTLVIVPTHSSNLDSLFLGYALDTFVGLPSSHYGAGLNLYNSEIAGYFMNRLGAYRVDRRKKNRIYLETLKTASRIAIKLGVNSLFFPGGTRSRSGEMEQNLKLGLLGTTIQAQRMLFEENSSRKIFIIPLVISYSNVLEDATLYNNYLYRQGLLSLARKNIPRRSSITRAFKLFGKLFSDDMVNYLSFGQPMDVFGNVVDENGHSLDKWGNRISKKEYFLQNTMLSHDGQREVQYTRHLSDFISDAYLKNNVVRVGNLVAAALLESIKEENNVEEVKSILQLPRGDLSCDSGLFFRTFESLIQRFKDYEAEGVCLLEISMLQPADVHALIEMGIKQLRTYQLWHVVKQRNDRFVTDHIGLLLFYANRLECYYQYEKQL